MTETIEGSVERITFYNPETGYCVLRLMPHRTLLGRGNALVTVVGVMPEVQPGEALKIQGVWENHATHGRQLRAEHVSRHRPATIEGIRRYLGSNLIKGVGPVTAQKIVDFFREETLDILDHSPERVREVPGVGKYRAEMIAQAWQEQRAIKEVMLFLQTYGLNTAIATRIYKTYGDEAIRIVEHDPYRLISDIWGVGFVTADRLAQELGIAPDATQRLQAGLIYTLNTASDDGHLYLPVDDLVMQTSQLLGVEPGPLYRILDQLVAQSSLVGEVPSEYVKDIKFDEIEVVGKQGPEKKLVVYFAPFYFAEMGTARLLHQLIDYPASTLQALRNVGESQLLAMIRRLSATDNAQLSDHQQRAVKTALTHKLSVLTGGPGTGKTTTLHTIIAVLEANRLSFKLASPTGRAAKRLSEATGHPAQTIHRLLAYSPAQGYGANEENPLKADMIVIDEASMLDALLFYALVKAIPPETHLLLVGDVDQLPSVGAGDVLRDIIDSAICPVIKLETIFRQAGDSMIIQNAHRINQGLLPDTSNQHEDFYFFAEDDPESAANLLVDIVRNRIPQKFGFQALSDIQVLTPMYRGSLGVHALNQALQENLNPNPNGRKAERKLHGILFRAGDKVLQTRNNYDKEVFNGDIGRVHSFDMEDQTMTVDMDGRLVIYEWAECDELTLAYAVTVHKSQGSEYPVVVLPVHTQHYIMLQRNLLYTGVTRAKKLVVLVGMRRALAMMVKNAEVGRRNTALAWRLSYPLG